MPSSAIYCREAENELLLLKNRPSISGVTYPIYLKPCTGLGLPCGIRQKHVFKHASLIVVKVLKKLLSMRNSLYYCIFLTVVLHYY